MGEEREAERFARTSGVTPPDCEKCGRSHKEVQAEAQRQDMSWCMSSTSDGRWLCFRCCRDEYPGQLAYVDQGGGKMYGRDRRIW